MATQLTDEEKKELSDAYVNSAYFLAVPMMKGKNTDYGKARALLEEVLPYANENDWTIVMNKIGASWYLRVRFTTESKIMTRPRSVRVVVWRCSEKQAR